MKNKRKIIILSIAIIVFGSLLTYKINQIHNDNLENAKQVKIINTYSEYKNTNDLKQLDSKIMSLKNVSVSKHNKKLKDSTAKNLELSMNDKILAMENKLAKTNYKSYPEAGTAFDNLAFEVLSLKALSKEHKANILEKIGTDKGFVASKLYQSTNE
ncbi:hypothetical protein PO181_07015 [Leuconostoc suionicum]|uniref:hypothetical protein n=1 Tax=Leuconostoc suionicum TaxID=1511761 RepID=UPI00233EF77E|nr:hypothetical protein [Leuconostoc suionicum]MDC2816732.1 hypothetical protein [Leuconostoc suionicum]